MNTAKQSSFDLSAHGRYEKDTRIAENGALVAYSGASAFPANRLTTGMASTTSIDLSLEQAKTELDPVFGFEIVCDVPDVPPKIFLPRQSWADKGAYDATAKKLAGLFNKNFETYAPGANAEVKGAAPKM